MLTGSESSQAHDGYPAPKSAWMGVAILSLTYMFAFMDRQILVLLVEPIKQDLQISDTQVSLLTGMAFALMYSVMGVPMGRLADNYIRKRVIILGVAVWSSLTICCGLARNFSQLFFARMGVGFGEAALTPAAYSMVADLFPPNRLSRGMSVFVLGGSVGGAMSLLIGGAIIGWAEGVGNINIPFVGAFATWQWVLISVGILSFLMVIPLSLMQEPNRHHAIQPETNNMRFKGVLGYIREKKSFYGLFVPGVCVVNMCAYGVGAWLPSYFIRVHEWDPSTTGVLLGALYIVPALLGGLLSGRLSDYFYSKGLRSSPIYIITIALLLSAISIPMIIFAPSMEVKLLFFLFASFLGVMGDVLYPTIIQLATLSPIRAQVSAIYLLLINLTGIGFGPTVIALVTDNYFMDEIAVGKSIASVSFVFYVIGALLILSSLSPFLRQSDHSKKYIQK
ncbi:MFS transporter [SAR92 clade bacterium H246]